MEAAGPPAGAHECAYWLCADCLGWKLLAFKAWIQPCRLVPALLASVWSYGGTPAQAVPGHEQVCRWVAVARGGTSSSVLPVQGPQLEPCISLSIAGC